MTHLTRIREVPDSVPRPTILTGVFRDFSQSSRQMMGWIFITTIHLTIIYKIKNVRVKLELRSIVSLIVDPLFYTVSSKSFFLIHIL